MREREIERGDGGKAECGRRREDGEQQCRDGQYADHHGFDLRPERVIVHLLLDRIAHFGVGDRQQRADHGGEVFQPTSLDWIFWMSMPKSAWRCSIAAVIAQRAAWDLPAIISGRMSVVRTL